MKRIISLFIVLLLVLPSCNKQGVSGTWIIAARYGYSMGMDQMMPHYLVSKADNLNWISVDDIRGFDYEEGFECSVKAVLIVEYIKDPPADGSSRIRYLDGVKLLKKEKKDSENLPEPGYWCE